MHSAVHKISLVLGRFEPTKIVLQCCDRRVNPHGPVPSLSASVLLPSHVLAHATHMNGPVIQDFSLLGPKVKTSIGRHFPILWC